MKITLSNPHGNDKLVSIQYAISLDSFNQPTRIIFATDWCTVFAGLQLGGSEQKQRPASSARGF